jgi:hypothetical protein
MRAFALKLRGGITMRKPTALLVAAAVCVICSTASALYDVANTGIWPKTWPAELEPLREKSRTLVGPLAPYMNRHYAIRFTSREEFESAWPHILKVKGQGTPVFLVRGPNFFLEKGSTAGVVIHSPPEGQPDNPATPEEAIPVKDVSQARINTTYIELVVDGEIVDLNRIPLPADTPIVDKRFEEGRSGPRK